MDNLAVLRTAKQALDEGLVNSEDYDFIKKAFLRAQQIKAGLDAGFIKEAEFVQARDSFLHSLDFALVGSASSAPVAQYQQPSVPSSPKAAPAPLQPINTRPQPQPPAPYRAQRESPTGMVQPGPAIPPPAPSVSAPAAVPAQGLGSRSNSGIINAAGTVPIPTDIPSARGSRISVASNKTSMSGISVNEQCVAIFNHIKSKSAHKWVTFKVNDAGNEVIVDQLGSADSTYDQFVNILPENNCRYGVYDYAYQNADTNQTINKLVFVHWAPDCSTTKSKMMYASTKDFLKNYLDGLGAELQATDSKELAESEMRERVHQAITRK